MLHLRLILTTYQHDVSVVPHAKEGQTRRP
jgi:hypothetical protein